MASRVAYDRSTVTPGIVHIGIGAFARAHLAVYIDGLLAAHPTWGIIGASLRRSDTRHALLPQDFLYTLVVKSRAGTEMRTIGSLLDVIDASADRTALLKAMVDPRTRIVSLTVTEKGYCHDPATGRLDPHHPEIVHDLGRPDDPVSVPGLLVRALELRRLAGVPPFAVLSCDNLPANGATTARVVSGFAALRSRELADYIGAEVAFPSTMVDRIVPATTEADRALVLEQTGTRDAWPVVTEPFAQWVVEDHFPAGRPPLREVGVELVPDVRPFELMKLRMLNGSHSTLAYLGYLAGYEFVSDAIENPGIRSLVDSLMTREVIVTLPTVLGDLHAYRDALLGRFANPALRHRTWQIAMDGTQKLPQRLLGTIRDCISMGVPCKVAVLGVAAWMRYAMGVDEHGQAIDVRDPLAERLKTIAGASGRDAQRLVEGFLGIREVFGDDLPRNEVFRRLLVAHLSALLEQGANETVRKTMAGL